MLLKWTNKIITYILILVFLLILYSTISSRINGGAPRVFGIEILTVLSGSMEPGIKTGSIIGVKPVTSDQKGTLKSGDVITFKSVDDPNVLITHRIVEVQSAGNSVEYITRGDNNDANDLQPISSENIVSKYVNFTIPLLGYFLTWVKSKVGIAVLLIVPGIFLIISSIYSLFRTILRVEALKGQESSPGETPPATNG